MEFFLPGVLLFLVAIMVVYFIAPNITPFVTAILAIIFLTFGVYTHYSMFKAEYRLSTWQEGFKIYAPAIMIIAIILFILYSMVSIFTNIHVPVPEMPKLEMPNTDSLTNYTMNVYNNVANKVSTATNSLSNTVSNATNSLKNSLTTSNQNKKPNVSRSFVETF
jgi:predicted PurR-regulated permease PerM